MKKLIPLALFLALVWPVLHSQEVLNVQSESESTQFPMEKLHKLTFEKDSFFLTLKDGTVFPYSFDVLNHLTFGENASTNIQTAYAQGQTIGLFPNPVRNYLNYKLSIPKEANITIINLQGKVMLQKTGHPCCQRIDVSFLESGLYLIQLQIGNSSTTKMFIKQ